jgi:hypothetical protein
MCQVAQLEIPDGSSFSFDPQGTQRQAGGFSQRQPVSFVEKWIKVLTLDGDFDGSTAWSNVSASFVVQGNLDAAQLAGRIAGILFSGPGTAVPSDVTVLTYVRMDPEVLGARLFVADKSQAFSAMSMTWNSVNYASLGWNSNVYTAPHGWKVCEVFVPLTDINIAVSGSPAGNRIDLAWTTYEDGAFANELHQSAWYAIP